MPQNFPILCFLCLVLCSPIISFGQTTNDFKKEIADAHFTHVSYKKIPGSFLKNHGITNRHLVGDSKSECGCTSKARMIVKWMVSDKHGLSVLSVMTCGFTNITEYYVLSGKQEYRLHVTGNYEGFDAFKKGYCTTEKE